MGEWTYLSTAAKGKQGEALLGAKRHYPFAWALAFEPGGGSPEGKLVAPLDEANARAARRAAKIAKRAGPKLRAVLDGFVSFISALKGESLVYDASEIASAYGSARESLLEVTELAARFDARKGGISASALGEWGMFDPSGDDEQARSMLEVDDVYLCFGSSMGQELAWLRPPEPDDTDRLRMIREVFRAAGYVLTAGPEAQEGGIVLSFSHPRHRGVAFLVDERFRFSAHEAGHVRDLRRRGEDQTYVSFSEEARSPAQLAAWAGHVAEHFQLFTFPRGRWANAWWQDARAAEVGERMQPLDEDVVALRAGLGERLDRAIRDALRLRIRVGHAANVDLGPLGCLVLEPVVHPDWEPHVRATLHPSAGDPSWRNADPRSFVPPSVQQRIVAGWLDDLAGRAATGAVVLLANEDRPQLSLEAGRPAPERFVVREGGRFHDLVPARALVNEEVEGRYVFVGAAMIIVATADTRTAFKLPVPADLDRSVPPRVSGFWTAKSGDRFASVLRIGSRAWRFDNDGRLLGPIG